MRTSLLRSKKGQVVDFFAGIQRAITWLLHTAPKPLLAVIFLLFLVVFSALFGTILNTTGSFCDTSGNEYRTGTFNIITNIQLLSSMPSNEDLNSETLDADSYTKGTVLECSYLYPPNVWVYYERGEKTLYNLSSGYYFKDDGCIICEESVYAYPTGVFFGGRSTRINICLDETIYPKAYEDMSFLSKRNCGESLGRCAVPEGYYYDSNLDKFICYDGLCMNEEGSVNTLGEIWNLKLKEKGAKLQAPSVYGDKDYRNAVNIECEAGNITPKLRFFGIEVFNYKIWVFLMLLSGLMWAVFKIKRH